MENREIASLFHALSDENRVCVLKMLQAGERCACELLRELDVSQPTLSHHMKILCESGLVNDRREGKWTYYSISADGAKATMQVLKELTTLRKGRRRKPCCADASPTK